MEVREAIEKLEARLGDGTGRAMEFESCEYITEDNRRCGVGILLTEEECHRIKEENNVGWSVAMVSVLGEDHWTMQDPWPDLLPDIQEVHDVDEHWVFDFTGRWELSDKGEEALQRLKNRWL